MSLRRSAEALFRLFELHVQFIRDNNEEIPAEEYEIFTRAMVELTAHHVEFKTAYAILPKGKDTKKTVSVKEDESGSLENIATDSSLDEHILIHEKTATTTDFVTIQEERISASTGFPEYRQKETLDSPLFEPIHLSPLPITPSNENYLNDSSDLMLMQMHYSATSESRLERTPSVLTVNKSAKSLSRVDRKPSITKIDSRINSSQPRVGSGSHGRVPSLANGRGANGSQAGSIAMCKSGANSEILVIGRMEDEEGEVNDDDDDEMFAAESVETARHFSIASRKKSISNIIDQRQGGKFNFFVYEF